MAEDPAVGTVVMATNMAQGQDFMVTCSQALEKTWAASTKPIVLMGNVSATMSPAECNRFRAMGIPVLMGTETALRALAHYSAHFQPQASEASMEGALTRTPNPPSPERLAHWKTALQGCAKADQSLQSFALLEDFGLPTAQGLSTSDWGQALAFSEKVGFPLVAKIDAPELAHKSDIGGVILGITNAQQLQAAWNELQAKLPGAVLLQRQLQGTELILGMQKDPSFGPIFTVGLGGIFVEIMKDVALLLPNDSKQTIRNAVLGLRSAALLQGARGRAVADIDALTQVIQNFMAMGIALQDAIQEAEINPLLVSGSDMAAVDCLVIPVAPCLIQTAEQISL